MEFLSKQSNESDGSNINLVVQSPQSQANGYNAVFTPGFALPHLPFRPDKDFHEYRFDWTPSQVAFYADSQLLHVMTENIPDHGGHMVFNHWSNGDPGWSAGPPIQDTYLTISHAHFYFNSSDPKMNGQFDEDCGQMDFSKVCTINNNISVALMPATNTASSFPSPSLPVSTDPEPSATVGTAPGGTSLNAAKHQATTIYIIVGVIVGLIIILFSGCMMTIRYLIALKNKLLRRIALWRNKKAARSEEAKSHPLELGMKTPDTELDSQATPVKAREGI